MKKEIRLLLTAIMFYTRIPVPKKLEYSDDLLNRSTKYFPFIGWIVGGFGAGIFYVSHMVFPFYLSILLSMISTILLTGAFHEDGFADTCDAFGGGWNKEKILEIMKDSRIGTYGSIGLVFILSFKFLALASLPASDIPFILIIAHSISRLSATSLIYYSKYARADASTKTKPVGKKLSALSLLMATILGVLPFILHPNYLYLLSIIPLVFLILFLKRYFEKWIGGFTGDCLGATQQLSEVIVYLCIIVIQSLI